jgi:tRNA pseudouridine38-40 synthase
MSVLMRVAYDGSGISGWARQPGAVRTVQAELEAALSERYGTVIQTRAASRTDAGVHAEGQLVAFDVPEGAEGPPADRLVAALAGALPPEISVWRAWEEVRADGSPAQPRFDNGGKHYRYRIRPGAPVDEPRTRRYEWRLRRPLEEDGIDAMRRAAAHMVGRHDFTSFRAAGCQARGAVRNMRAVDVRVRLEPTATAGGEPRPVLEVHVDGEAFLMHMVRIMVGTLVDVGIGRTREEDVPALFTDPARENAGPTAPAHGLTLVQVLWPGASD